MIEVASVISCTACLVANLYMAINTKTLWIKWAAGMTAGLCVSVIALNTWLLAHHY